jgi:hypothetical protein
VPHDAGHTKTLHIACTRLMLQRLIQLTLTFEGGPRHAGLPTVLQTSGVMAAVPAVAPEQLALMHAACAVELLHHAGGIAGDGRNPVRSCCSHVDARTSSDPYGCNDKHFAPWPTACAPISAEPIAQGRLLAQISVLAAQTVDRLLLPLLSTPSSALLTEARRSELAVEAAALLMSLQMEFVACDFVVAAGWLICRGASCSIPTAGSDVAQGTSIVGAALESGCVVGCTAATAAAAATGCWSAAQQVQDQLTQQQQQVLARCPQMSSLPKHHPQPVPPSAAVLLMCQLAQAAVAAVEAEEAQWLDAPAQDDREPSPAVVLAFTAATKCVNIVTWLVSAPQPEAGRWDHSDCHAA